MNDAAVPRPRTKPAAVRREELLDAAQQLFLERGVGATSVDEIVAAAGVAKGTFYLYFAAKEHVLTALAERYVHTFGATLAAALDGRRADDWFGRLDVWVAVAVRYFLDRIALHDIVFRDAHAAHEHGDNPTVDRLAGLLADGTRAGAWAVDEPRLTAVMLFCAMHGCVDEAAAAAGAESRAKRVNRKRLIAALTTFFRRAVAPPEGASTAVARE